MAAECVIRGVHKRNGFETLLGFEKWTVLEIIAELQMPRTQKEAGGKNWLATVFNFALNIVLKFFFYTCQQNIFGESKSCTLIEIRLRPIEQI